MSNSLFCLGSWTLGDVIVQYLEHEHRNFRIRSGQVDEYTLSSSSSSRSSPSSSRSLNTKCDKELSLRASPFEWNQQRTLNLASFGVFINGPILAKWYPWLDHRVKQFDLYERYIQKYAFPLSKSMVDPIAKVGIELLVLDIPFLTLFFGYMNMIQGGSWDMFVHKIKHELPSTYMASVGFWSATQLWNFRFVPIVYQSVFVHVISVVWDGFLSYRNEASNLETKLDEYNSNSDKDDIEII